MFDHAVVYRGVRSVVTDGCYACDPTAGPVRDGAVLVDWMTAAGTLRRESVCLLDLHEFLYQRERDRARNDDRILVWFPSDAADIDPEPTPVGEHR